MATGIDALGNPVGRASARRTLKRWTNSRTGSFGIVVQQKRRHGVATGFVLNGKDANRVGESGKVLLVATPPFQSGALNYASQIGSNPDPTRQILPLSCKGLNTHWRKVNARLNLQDERDVR